MLSQNLNSYPPQSVGCSSGLCWKGLDPVRSHHTSAVRRDVWWLGVCGLPCPLSVYPCP